MRLSAVLLSAALLTPLSAQETLNPHGVPAAPAPVTDLNAFFLRSCAGCHGQDGSATRPDGKKGKAQDLTSAWWQKHTRNDEIVDAILNGRKPFFGGRMPAFKGRISEGDALKLATEVVRKLQKGVVVKAGS